jgi:hypothetical protein
VRLIPEAAVLLLAMDYAGAEATHLLAYGHWAILCLGCWHPKHVWSKVALLLFLGWLLLL